MGFLYLSPGHVHWSGLCSVADVKLGQANVNYGERCRFAKFREKTSGRSHSSVYVMNVERSASKISLCSEDGSILRREEIASSSRRRLEAAAKDGVPQEERTNVERLPCLTTGEEGNKGIERGRESAALSSTLLNVCEGGREFKFRSLNVLSLAGSFIDL